MKRRLMFTAAAGLSVIALQLGCASVGKRSLRETSTPAADAVLAKSRSEAQLPPQETAAACLATARELEKSNHVEPAIQLYEKARQNDPKVAGHVGRRLAVLYDKKGDFTKAMEEYSKALQQSPKDSDLLNNIGYSYYCRGQYDEAEANYRKALAIAPHNPRVWNNLGLLMGMQGRAEDSRVAFEKAVTGAQARCNVAFLLAARGQTEEAKAYYQKALELEPSLKIAQDALAKLGVARMDGGAGLTPASAISSAAVAPVQP